MTDQELLDLSAKAAGYKYAKNGGYIVVDGIPGNWNPLADDGDALRLAVSLNLSVKHGVDIWDDNQKMSAYAYLGDFGECFFEEHGSDPYAATRRAIVRAAAEIGRNMK